MLAFELIGLAFSAMFFTALVSGNSSARRR
jgi:hypothetical protein